MMLHTAFAYSRKKLTNEEPHNLYTKDEKIGNARILSLVLSLVSCMFDTAMHVFSAEGCSTVTAQK